MAAAAASLTDERTRSHRHHAEAGRALQASDMTHACVIADPSHATCAGLRRGTVPSGRRDALDCVHSGASMNFRSQYSSRPELIDDHQPDTTDAPERTVLSAVRTWLRPACETARGGAVHWRDILSGVGLRQDGIEHFDLLMRSLMHVSYRPLDMRCRCASDLGKDEAVILQTIALLQKTHSGAALRMLAEWLPAPAVSGVLKLIRWFAIDLLDAGVELDVQARRVTYMH
jgi:hypothetical protein